MLQAALLFAAIFILHEKAHFVVAKYFDFAPNSYFDRKIKNFSMSWICPIGTPFWKISAVILAGPMVEFLFLAIGIYLNIFVLKFVSICMLFGSSYDFWKLINLFRFRHHYKQWGYCGT